MINPSTYRKFTDELCQSAPAYKQFTGELYLTACADLQAVRKKFCKPESCF
jgi:uncharacterized protein CbrC (UPF0167 family)